jgi:hypothetical protein
MASRLFDESLSSVSQGHAGAGVPNLSTDALTFRKDGNIAAGLDKTGGNIATLLGRGAGSLDDLQSVMGCRD